VMPGERILEIGAGSGLWTGHLTDVLRGENPITAAVFNEDLARAAADRALRNVSVVHTTSLGEFPPASFDYIVGTAILCQDQYPQTLRELHRLLKPGGQILFFEANQANPQVFLKDAIRPLGRWAGNAACQVGLRRYPLLQLASRQGFTQIEIIPFDILHASTPRRLIPALQSLAFILEHTPLIRNLCGTLYIWARKPGDERARRPRVNLARGTVLRDAVSVVVPCHNEEPNVGPLAEALLETYEPYLHEIIFVNDNSTDGTADAVRRLSARLPRARLVDRSPPHGVGRALRDGYAAATGRYILTMDSDFVQIVPELRDLFDAVEAGHDGAIGSRFSHESILINYPFLKIFFNRCFHLLANLLLPRRFRDISNNLKLYRADILRSTSIEEPRFAANVETGLKPLLAGYDVVEVPISWINRTIDMGSSSFHIVKVAPDYLFTLLRIVRASLRQRLRSRPGLVTQSTADGASAARTAGADALAARDADRS